jgi:hypothetical protein
LDSPRTFGRLHLLVGVRHLQTVVLIVFLLAYKTIGFSQDVL